MRASRPAPRTQAQPHAPRRENLLEEHILSILVQNAELIPETETVKEEWFAYPSYREIFKKLTSGFQAERLTEGEFGDLGEPLVQIRSRRLLTDARDHLIRDLKEGIKLLEIRYLKRLKLAEKTLLENQESMDDMGLVIDQHKLSTNRSLKRAYS